MTIRSAPGKPTTNVRLCISNDSGYSIDLHLYSEAIDPKTGVIRFESYIPANRDEANWRPGPMHGLAISTPYLTKDYLQAKRFQAQSGGTTYVYDLPDMFRQQLEKAWAKHLEEKSDSGKIFTEDYEKLNFLLIITNYSSVFYRPTNNSA